MYKSNTDLLRDAGINLLTGEADKYSLRILCDVSDQGKKLITEFFGLAEVHFTPNWNSMVGEELATGSFLLPRGMIQDLVLFIWFYKRNAYAVVEGSGFGYTDYTEEDVNRHIALYGNVDDWGLRRNWNYSKTQPTCDRNEHMMSGRVY